MLELVYNSLNNNSRGKKCKSLNEITKWIVKWKNKKLAKRRKKWMPEEV